MDSMCFWTSVDTEVASETGKSESTVDNKSNEILVILEN